MSKKLILVYAYVCGDIIHKGHIEHLRNAKSLGDRLIVGVLTDEAIMEKKSKPTLSFEERADMIRALKGVDMVVAQEEYLPTKNAINLGVDVLAESESHNHIDAEWIKSLEAMSVRVVVFPYYPGHSSTGIKNRIKK